MEKNIPFKTNPMSAVQVIQILNHVNDMLHEIIVRLTETQWASPQVCRQSSGAITAVREYVSKEMNKLMKSVDQDTFAMLQQASDLLHEINQHLIEAQYNQKSCKEANSAMVNLREQIGRYINQYEQM